VANVKALVPSILHLQNASKMETFNNTVASQSYKVLFDLKHDIFLVD